MFLSKTSYLSVHYIKFLLKNVGRIHYLEDDDDIGRTLFVRLALVVRMNPILRGVLAGFWALVIGGTWQPDGSN